MRTALIPCLILFIARTYGQAPDSILSRVEDALSVAEKISILNEAASASVNADLKKSFIYGTQALSLARNSGDERAAAIALLNLGKYYSRLGQYETSMKQSMEAYEIGEKTKDDNLRSLAYKTMGNNYYFKEDFSRALEYYKRAISVNQRVNNEENTADLQNNIALIFIESNKTDSAIYYLQKAAYTYDKIARPEKLSNSLLNIGLAKNQGGSPGEAIDYYHRALDINRATGRKLQEGVTLNNIASALIKEKKYNEAERFALQALKIGQEEKFRTLLLNVYENLYQLAKIDNRFALALDWHEKILELKDHISNEQQSQRIEEIRINYESLQKEREYQSLLLEASVKERQLNVTRLTLFFIGILAVAAMVLAFSYYRTLVQNRKAREKLTALNRFIIDQKEEISETAKKLSVANDEIASINDNLKMLVEEKTSRIVEQNNRLIEYTFHNSHRVRGPLTRILGLINLVRIDAVEKEEINYVLREIESASLELDAVIKEINASLTETLAKTEV